MKTFLFQINVTRDCNLRCSHCYISSEKKAISSVMSLSDVMNIIHKITDFMINDSAARQQYTRAEIHIIGGEPTMLGEHFYSQLLPQATAMLGTIPQDYALILVSNLLDKDSVEIARMFKQVSTSFEVATRFPKDKLQRRWEERVLHLVSDPNVVLSVTTSITKPIIEYGVTALMDYFLSLGLKHMHLGFFIPAGDGLINQLAVFPDFEATSDYLIELTDWYVDNRPQIPDLAINPIESLIQAIYYDSPADDIVCPIIPGSLDFDSDGNTVTCIEKGGEVEVDWIGNIFSQSVSDIVTSDTYIKERLNAASPKGVCRGCSEYRVCQSGCSVLHQFWSGAGECPGFKKWILHTRQLVESGILPSQQMVA